MDGSAKNFLDKIKKRGLRNQFKKKKYLKILNKIEIKDGNRQISIEPDDSSLEVNFKLDYENKLIGKTKKFDKFSKR